MERNTFNVGNTDAGIVMEVKPDSAKGIDYQSSLVDCHSQSSQRKSWSRIGKH